ncbi:MAG TPA: phage BR0599 family protein [Sedimentisphaerales bacterium]|nr:phage BR0599 family protein [Sedimentisphaerales bacterium]HUU15577.1 phage BR0599 family protein [Sedimentisphaerales bacterium]
MTYESSEISVASGQPIEMHDIAMGLTHWRITSGPEDVEFLGHTYESAPCKRSEIEQTGEIPKDGVDLELPRGHALGMICTAGVPEEEVTLTTYRGHGTFFVTYWRGFLTSLKFNDKAIPICYFEPRSSDLPFVGGRRRCMRLCGHRLFGYRCGLNKEAYKITGTIDTISGITITATEFGDVYVEPPAFYGDITGLPGCTYVAKTSVDAIHTADRAFDDSLSSSYHWESASPGTDQWIYCKWTAAQTIKKVNIYKGSLSDYNIRYFRVEGSNNGTSWTAIDASSWSGDCQFYAGEGGSDTEILNSNNFGWITITLDNAATYTYYRIYIYNNWGGTTVFCQEIEMIEADSAMAAYYFGAGGEIAIGTARRTITAHNGNTITINRPFGTDVIAGSAFSAYPGCDHTPFTCRDKYANGINGGGQEGLPTKNPYAGDLIY